MYKDCFLPNNMPLIKWPTVPPNVQEANMYHREQLLMIKRWGRAFVYMASTIWTAVFVANCGFELNLETCVYMVKLPFNETKMGVLHLSYSECNQKTVTQPEYDVRLGYSHCFLHHIMMHYHCACIRSHCKWFQPTFPPAIQNIHLTLSPPYLYREYICCMTCVHSCKFLMSEWIPDDGMLIIWARGQ